MKKRIPSIKSVSIFLLVLLFVSFPGNVVLAEDVSSESASELKKGETTSEEATYIIGSGDILGIHTWKEPDFSGELQVRIDGKITLPLLNDVIAAGLTPIQLKKEIEKRLMDFVESPVVTVSVKRAESKKFYILGEVKKTSQFDLLKDLTVLQAIALAGGFTEWAAKNRITVIRVENGKERIIRINYNNIVKKNDFSQNIRIMANDTIIVP